MPHVLERLPKVVFGKAVDSLAINFAESTEKSLKHCGQLVILAYTALLESNLRPQGRSF